MPHPERFPRQARLLEASDFKRVFAKPVRSSDDLFTILARANGGTRARIGLAIAKKKVRRAVDRNRIKRLVRDSFRRHRIGLPKSDLVVLARQGTWQQPNQRLLDSLAAHWKRLARQCGKS